MTDPRLFLLAVLAVLFTPGPTNTLLASGGAVRGWRGGLPLVFAELCGYLVTVDLVGFLLRPVILSHPPIGSALKLGVALYLVWAAIGLWRNVASLESARTAVGWRSVFVATLLNPKGLVFALGIIPFGSPAIAGYLGAFAVSVLFAGVCWVGVGHLIGAAAGERRRLVPRLASVVLLGFAGLIAASAFG